MQLCHFDALPAVTDIKAGDSGFTGGIKKMHGTLITISKIISGGYGSDDLKTMEREMTK